MTRWISGFVCGLLATATVAGALTFTEMGTQRVVVTLTGRQVLGAFLTHDARGQQQRQATVVLDDLFSVPDRATCHLCFRRALAVLTEEQQLPPTPTPFPTPTRPRPQLTINIRR